MLIAGRRDLVFPLHCHPCDLQNYSSLLLVRLFAAQRLIAAVFLVLFEELAMVASIESIKIGDGIVAHHHNCA
jgi:hypothetical protein